MGECLMVWMMVPGAAHPVSLSPLASFLSHSIHCYRIFNRATCANRMTYGLAYKSPHQQSD